MKQGWTFWVRRPMGILMAIVTDTCPKSTTRAGEKPIQSGHGAVFQFDMQANHTLRIDIGWILGKHGYQV